MHLANYFIQGEIGHSGFPQWLAEQIGLYGNTPEAVQLNVWINSSGGDLIAAIEAINLMKSSPLPVHTFVNGCAESAALLIAIAGHRRHIFDTSWGMAHHFSTGMEGNYHDLQDTIKHNGLMHDMMVKLFKAHTKLTEEEITTKLLGRGTLWLSAQEMLDMGMVDEIITPSSALVRKVKENAVTKKKKKV